MHLVTHGHFRSRDKDGGHTIRSAIAKNPMLHANFMALCFMEPELLPIEVAGIEIFDLFGSCDLDLDPMTFTDELDPYSLEMYRISTYEPLTSRLSKVNVRHRDTQRDSHTDIHDRNYIHRDSKKGCHHNHGYNFVNS